MKLQLIMLTDPIIVSDDEIKEGELVLDQYNKIFKHVDLSKHGLGHGMKKIIAQSHQIDWNGFEEQFGHIDLKQLAWKQTNRLAYSGPHTDRSSECFIWIDGFKKAQELNDKKFSLEDMKEAIELARKFPANSSYFPTYSTDEIIQKVSKPKAFDIEVDMEQDMVCETIFNGNSANKGWVNKGFKPKVTGGKIKILKIVK